MRKRLWLCVLVVLLSLGVTQTDAQNQDAREVLDAVSRAMGTDNVRTIEYSGTGEIRAVGQNYSPYEDWPRFDLARYTRTIDYDARTSSEHMTRVQGNNAPRGGGGTPIQGEQERNYMVNGEYAWEVRGDDTRPQLAAADLRQLEIWMTPHGFVKAAAAADDLEVTRFAQLLGDVYGTGTTFLSFTALGKYRLNGQIDDQNRVLRVQTWIPNPVLGDMFYEHRYTGYQDYDGIQFPDEIHSHQGISRTREGGHNYMEVLPTSVQPNVSVAALTVPDAVQQASAPEVRVESESLANGVWHIRGGSHHSVAVEFQDHVTVVEAPQNEARSLAVIAEVKRLVPNKPIRYVVNTHHHFDHSGGLRTYIVHSATLVGHESNRAFYERLLDESPRMVEPDLLSSIHPWFSQTRYLSFEGVGKSFPVPNAEEKLVLSDGVRTMELYWVQGLNHSTGMLIAYLPTERILINADLYSPPAGEASPPSAPTTNMTVLSRNIERLGLDVDRHVGVHGGVGSHADFMRVVGSN